MDEHYTRLQTEERRWESANAPFCGGQYEMRIADYRDIEILPDSIVYCFDKDTEILTQRGWINVSEVTMADYCLSRNPENDVLEYVKVVDLISYHYKGKMYSYKGKNVDICVTPNHRMFCEVSETRKRIRRNTFIPAKDFFDRCNISFISSGGIWSGENTRTLSICDRIFNAEDFCYFLGLFLTDGCVNSQGNITISQTKEEVLLRLTEALDRMGIKYSKYPHKGRSGWTIYIERSLLPYFGQFYKKENRRIPRDIMGLHTSLLKCLFEGMMDGDGDSLNVEKRRRLLVGVKGLADDFQDLCYKIGLSSTIIMRQPQDSYLKSEDRIIHGRKPYYIVAINSKPRLNRIKSNQEWIEYDDMVNCVTLEKWHTVLVRRNGKPIWCGQCDKPYKATEGYGDSNKDDFDHDTFYKWAEDQEVPVFISEYTAPEDRFVCIAEFERTSTFSATNNSLNKIEKVYLPNKWREWWDNKNPKQKTLFDDI